MKHLHDLDDAIADWVGEPGVNPKPYEISGEFRPDGREYVFTGKLTKPLDDLLLWGVIFGDAVHNLRSALDHLVWQLVLVNGKKPTGANQFPICDTGANYWSLGKDGKQSHREWRLEGVSDAHKALIDEMQPYRTRIPPSAIHALSALRDLSNHDKHRLLHLTDFAVDFPSQEAMDNLLIANADAGQQIGTRFEPFRYDRETEVFAAEYSFPGPNPDVSVQGQPTLGIGISKSLARLSHVQVLAGEIGEMIEVSPPTSPPSLAGNRAHPHNSHLYSRYPCVSAVTHGQRLYERTQGSLSKSTKRPSQGDAGDSRGSRAAPSSGPRTHRAIDARTSRDAARCRALRMPPRRREGRGRCPGSHQESLPRKQRIRPSADN